jgi:hypothetical protein
VKSERAFWTTSSQKQPRPISSKNLFPLPKGHPRHTTLHIYEYNAYHDAPALWIGDITVPDSSRHFSYSDDSRAPPAYNSRSSRARTLSPPRAQSSTMASWLTNSKAQLAATAIVSGAIVAGGILGYQHVRRQEKVEDLKSSIPRLGEEHQADKVRCA